MTRYACSVDANQAEIADAFRRLGWDVIDTHAVAQLARHPDNQPWLAGFPDLIVIREVIVGMRDGLPVRQMDVLPIEVKGPRGRLTIAELAFAMAHPEWAPVVVRTVDEVVRITEEVDGE